MPILKFRCLLCNEIFDELVMGSNISDILCPGCGSNELERAYVGKCIGAQGASGCQGSCSSCKCCTK